MIRAIQRELALPDGSLGTQAREKRISAILRAQEWPSGTSREYRDFTGYYVSGDFEIKLGKPGKEVFRDLNPNVYDMTPTVFFKGIALDFKPTFQRLWKDLELIAPHAAPAVRQDLIQAMSALLFRAAFLLDHSEVEFRDGWKRTEQLAWQIPKVTGSFIEELAPTLGMPLKIDDYGAEILLPTDVYLQLIDAIALNEDVKYQSKNLAQGKAITSTGRVNTLLTTCYVLAGLLGNVHFMDVVVKMMTSKGVAPISQRDAKTFFYYLRGEDSEPVDSGPF